MDNLRNIIQINFLDDQKYKSHIDFDNEYNDVIQNYTNETDIMNVLFKYSSILPEILLYIDYKPYLKYTNVIKYLVTTILNCGDNAIKCQQNLPFHMICYTTAMDIIQQLLLTTNLDEDTRLSIIKEHTSTFTCVCQGYNYYQYPETLKFETENTDIILTMTSCKRLDLFIRTVQSFLVCCTDYYKISKWICIDDNSCEEDRKEMQRMFPFIEYIFKDESQKGHAKSMNILKNYVKEKYNPKYILHLEDDWKFITKYNFITHALNVLESDDNIKQCLFNLNYMETADFIIRGGLLKSTDNNYYYIEHEYDSIVNNIKHVSYWPHYSLRPSLHKIEVWDYEFPENSKHFELEYAYKYVSNGWKSTFLPSVICIHTGKLTSDANGLNAYTMNDQQQFRFNADLELTYVKLEDLYGQSKILKRLKRLRNKNWFCSHILEKGSVQEKYIKYVIDTFIKSINWDIIFIVNDYPYESKILLNKMEFIQDINNIVAFVVNNDKIDNLINCDNFSKLQNLNVIICRKY